MKKILALIVAGLVMISFSAVGFAAEEAKAPAQKVKAEVVKGEIVAIDAAKNEVTIKERKTGAEKKVVVDPREISTLKQGDRVKVILKEGTSTAEKIKVYAARKKAAK
jgi:predicted dinucleotide-binding enzyme